MELHENDAERDGEVADAPQVRGREELLQERVDDDTTTETEGDHR